MRIIVDRLPDSGKDCLFSILRNKYEPDTTIPNCMLCMRGAYDWTNMTFSYTDNGHNCLKDLCGSCPYLALEY